MSIEHNCKIPISVTLILILILSIHLLPAQNSKGVVLDEKLNKPLAGVNVFLKIAGIGTVTNESGEFYLKNISEINGSDTLYFSHIGYVTRKIIFSEVKATGYVVLLSEDVQNLKGITVVSERLFAPKIQYKTLTPLNGGLYSFGSVLVGDKIYIVGGDASFDTGTKALNENPFKKGAFAWQGYSDKLHIYDIPTDSWTTYGLRFSKRAYHSIHFYNDKIYILGGKTLSDNRRFEYLDDKIEVYDIKANTILVDKTNPHQTVNAASFLFNDNIIVMGGSTRLTISGEKEYSNKVHMLNLKTGYWYELNDMPHPKEAKGVLVDSTIYLIGGFNLKPLKEIETYNIASGEWRVEGQLFYEVERPAVAYNENIIYIFENGRIQTYNILTKELSMYSIDLPLKSAELFYTNNTLYIFGGLDEYELSYKPSADMYSIDLKEFKKAEVNSTKTF